MGDRAVIRIKPEPKRPNLCIYLHWGGETYKGDTARALEAARGRWDDPEYATRIIVGQVIAEYNDELTGCGLYTEMPDEELDYGPDRAPLTVDLTAKTVQVDGEQAVPFDTFINYYSPQVQA